MTPQRNTSEDSEDEWKKSTKQSAREAVAHVSLPSLSCSHLGDFRLANVILKEPGTPNVARKLVGQLCVHLT